MLTDAERTEIKALIESEIVRLEESLRILHEKLEPVAPDASIGRISRMDSLVNQETAGMSLVDSQKRLQRLRDKLERINEPEFGKCAGCGTWITMDRLRAAPDRGVCPTCLTKPRK